MIAAFRLFAAAALFVFAAAMPVRGEGALAVAIPDEGMHKGFAYGWKLHAAKPEDARKEALQLCQETAAKNKVPAGKCKIVEVFKKSCVAVALDQKGAWAGWGVGGDEKTAKARAMRQCKVGGSACAVAESDCDK